MSIQDETTRKYNELFSILSHEDVGQQGFLSAIQIGKILGSLPHPPPTSLGFFLFFYIGFEKIE